MSRSLKSEPQRLKTLISHEGTPAAAAVVAAPRRKLSVKQRSAGRPRSCSAEQSSLVREARVSHLPLQLVKVNTGSVAAGLHCSGSLSQPSQDRQSWWTLLWLRQSLAKGVGFRLRDGSEQMVGGFNVKDKGNKPYLQRWTVGANYCYCK